MKRYYQMIENFIITKTGKLLQNKIYSPTLYLPAGNYDIIGDVHGYTEELTRLLEKMGYSCHGGTWRHLHRKAIFTGDFVNRGPNTRGAVDIIRKMHDNNTGFAILGNHELNAIGYFTTGKKGKPIGRLSGSNIKQLEATRTQFNDNPELHADYIKWLRRLPFFINLGSARVAHAYWDNHNVLAIEQTLANGKLTRKLVKEIFRDKTSFSTAVKQTTRGIEIKLPKNIIVKDGKNIRRVNFRVKWWESSTGKTLNEICFGNRFDLPDLILPGHVQFPYNVYGPGEPMIFFGHYCIGNGSLIQRSNVCCVDSCIAVSGRLTAYRWNGETTMEDTNIVFVNR